MGPGPGDSLLVCWGSDGQTLYQSLQYNTHVAVVRSAPSYGLALRVAFGRTQSSTLELRSHKSPYIGVYNTNTHIGG